MYICIESQQCPDAGLTVDIIAGDTIGSLKAGVARHFGIAGPACFAGIPADRMLLDYGGLLLEDGSLLEDHDIQPGAVLELVVPGLPSPGADRRKKKKKKGRCGRP